MTADLLRSSQLSIVSTGEDNELQQIQQVIETKVVIDGRFALEEALSRLALAAAPPTPKTLDLIGHSTGDKGLLVLGDWVIDATSPTVTAFFRGLAENDVLAKLGIQAVRLLACLTADTPRGRWTMSSIAEILGIPVLGATGLIFASHYGSAGFLPERTHLLRSSNDLANDAAPRPLTRGTGYPRTLDVDALRAEPLCRRSWPVRVASTDEARRLLRLVRRRDGGEMVGLLSRPSYEIAFPSAVAGSFHALQVLLDAELVRIYGPGADDPGIVFPVDDPFTFQELAMTLKLL